MPSSQGPRGAHLTLYHRISLTSKISTRLQTLDYICLLPAHNRHRDRLQPAEASTPYSECVAIDLTTALDTVSHDILTSKIAGSSLPLAITRWRQAATSFRGIMSSTRIVRPLVPQPSKLLPSLFNDYIADMSRPTPPVKRVCYADDITVWASGQKIPQLESMINSYLRDVGIYLKENSHRSQQSCSSPRTNTSSIRIQMLLFKIHDYH